MPAITTPGTYNDLKTAATTIATVVGQTIPATKQYKFKTLGECEETLRSLKHDFKLVKHEQAKNLIKKELDEVRKIYSSMLEELKKIDLNEYNKPKTIVYDGIKNYITSFHLSDWCVKNQADSIRGMGGSGPINYMLPSNLKVGATVRLEMEIPCYSPIANMCSTREGTINYIISSMK